MNAQMTRHKDGTRHTVSAVAFFDCSSFSEGSGEGGRKVQDERNKGVRKEGSSG
jgi:hypothetical protein